MPALNRGWHAALDFLYPPACMLCGAAPEDSCALCDECLVKCAPIIEHACARCLAPVGPYLDTRDGCIHCEKDRFVFDDIFRLGVYGDELRTAVLRMKQPGHTALTATLVNALLTREASKFEDVSPDLVLPVPQYWMQRLRSGHNAAATVGRLIARHLRCPLHLQMLRKVRWTPAQASLKATPRKRNLKDAFRLRGGKHIAGKRILLTDDVLTTGTTANRIARVLKDNGAAHVAVAVIARGIGNKS